MSETEEPGVDARALLAAAGLRPNDDEVVMLSAMYPLLREAANSIYTIDLDYEP